MPIFTFDAPATTDKPAAEKPAPVVVCTLADSDRGDRCRWCGWPSGSGHGKERR